MPTHEETDLVAVKLSDGADADKVAQTHGYKNIGQIGSLKGLFTFQKLANQKRDVAPLELHEHVLETEQQVKRKRFTRSLETVHDPLWNHQWHLHGSSISLNTQAV